MSTQKAAAAKPADTKKDKTSSLGPPVALYTSKTRPVEGYGSIRLAYMKPLATDKKTKATHLLPSEAHQNNSATAGMLGLPSAVHLRTVVFASEAFQTIHRTIIKLKRAKWMASTNVAMGNDLVISALFNRITQPQAERRMIHLDKLGTGFEWPGKAWEEFVKLDRTTIPENSRQHWMLLQAVIRIVRELPDVFTRTRDLGKDVATEAEANEDTTDVEVKTSKWNMDHDDMLAAMVLIKNFDVQFSKKAGSTYESMSTSGSNWSNASMSPVYFDPSYSGPDPLANKEGESNESLGHPKNSRYEFDLTDPVEALDQMIGRHMRISGGRSVADRSLHDLAKLHSSSEKAPGDGAISQSGDGEASVIEGVCQRAEEEAIKSAERGLKSLEGSAGLDSLETDADRSAILSYLFRGVKIKNNVLSHIENNTELDDAAIIETSLKLQAIEKVKHAEVEAAMYEDSDYDDDRDEIIAESGAGKSNVSKSKKRSQAVAKSSTDNPTSSTAEDPSLHTAPSIPKSLLESTGNDPLYSEAVAYNGPDPINLTDFRGVRPKLNFWQELGMTFIVKRLLEERLRGVLLADDCGLGKTMLCLSSIVLYNRKRRDDPSFNGPYYPHLIVAPANAINVWLTEYASFFSQELTLRRYYGTPSASSSSTTSGLDQIISSKELAQLLFKDLDPTNPDTMRTVILTAYPTLARRTLQSQHMNDSLRANAPDEISDLKIQAEKSGKPNKDYDGFSNSNRQYDYHIARNFLGNPKRGTIKKVDPDKNRPGVLPGATTRPSHHQADEDKDSDRDDGDNDEAPEDVVSLLRGNFSLVVCDEAHAIKNRRSSRNVAVRSLDPYGGYILASATPFLNDIQDLIPFLELVCPVEYDVTPADADSEEKLIEFYRNKKINMAEKLSPTTFSLFLDEKYRTLDNHISFTVLPIVFEAMMLRRYCGQQVKLAPDNIQIVAGNIPPYRLFFTVCEADPVERIDLAKVFRRFAAIIGGGLAGDGRAKTRNSIDKKPTGSQNMMAFRQLQQTAFTPTSFKLRDRQGCDKLESQRKWAQRDFGANQLFESLCDDARIRPELFTKNAKVGLDFLGSLSPKLRVLAGIMNYHCVQRKQKLLVLHEWPLSAYQTHIFVRLTGLNLATITSETSIDDRISILNSFNDLDSDLQVLISNVCLIGQGQNAHKACFNLVIMESQRNYSMTVQALGRVNRLGQEHVQNIYLIYCANSFDEKLHARSTYKMIPSVVAGLRQSPSKDISLAIARMTPAEQDAYLDRKAREALRDYFRQPHDMLGDDGTLGIQYGMADIGLNNDGSFLTGMERAWNLQRLKRIGPIHHLLPYDLKNASKEKARDYVDERQNTFKTFGFDTASIPTSVKNFGISQSFNDLPASSASPAAIESNDDVEPDPSSSQAQPTPTKRKRVDARLTNLRAKTLDKTSISCFLCSLQKVPCAQDNISDRFCTACLSMVTGYLGPPNDDRTSDDLASAARRVCIKPDSKHESELIRHLIDQLNKLRPGMNPTNATFRVVFEKTLTDDEQQNILHYARVYIRKNLHKCQDCRSFPASYEVSSHRKKKEDNSRTTAAEPETPTKNKHSSKKRRTGTLPDNDDNDDNDDNTQPPVQKKLKSVADKTLEDDQISTTKKSNASRAASPTKKNKSLKINFNPVPESSEDSTTIPRRSNRHQTSQTNQASVEDIPDEEMA